jgi:hypothetical protein
MEPEHLRATTSNDRGFRRLPPIPGTHGGRPAGQVHVYESSAANGPHLWLSVEQPADRNHPENGEVVEATVHIALDDAMKVADQIRWMAEHHYQNV